MSEQNAPCTGEHETERPLAPNAGVLLRRARESAGVTLEALAVTLKVSARKLEALEAGNLEALPDVAFARALAASVCRTLKCSPEPVLEQLPSISPKLKPEGSGLNAPFHGRPERGMSHPEWRLLSSPLVLAVLALLSGAVVLIFLPSIQVPWADPPLLPGGGAAEVSKLSGAAASVVSTQPATSSVSAFVGSTATSLESDQSAAGPGQPVSGPQGGGPDTALLPPPVARDTGALSMQTTTGVVVFKTSGASWVEVRDAHGVAVLRRTLAAGESASASGVFPLSVLVGRADVTQVQVYGVPFDLSAVARDNVAKFEVKQR